jgi:hypothetical protein
MRYWEIVGNGTKIVEPKLHAASPSGPRDTKPPAQPQGSAESGHLKKASGSKSSR